MGHIENSAKGEIYSYKYLHSKTRRIWNQQPNSQLKEVEEEEHTKPKASRKNEIIKTRAINEIENRKTMEKNQWKKFVLFLVKEALFPMRNLKKKKNFFFFLILEWEIARAWVAEREWGRERANLKQCGAWHGLNPLPWDHNLRVRVGHSN